jgi:hypothetical protein
VVPILSQEGEWLELSTSVSSLDLTVREYLFVDINVGGVPSQMIFKTTCKTSEREREITTLKEPLRSACNAQGQLTHFALTKNKSIHFLIHSIGLAHIEN